MKIKIRLVGQLEDYRNTDEPLDLDEGRSVFDALSLLKIPSEELGMVAVNGTSVSKESRSTTMLTDGDQLTVMALVKGG